MKFNYQGSLQSAIDDEVRVGDVYPAKGGSGDTAIWVVVATSGDGKSVKVLGVDTYGDIVSATGYNMHSLRSRHKIGFVKELSELAFDIDPI